MGQLVRHFDYIEDEDWHNNYIKQAPKLMALAIFYFLFFKSFVNVIVLTNKKIYSICPLKEDDLIYVQFLFIIIKN